MIYSILNNNTLNNHTKYNEDDSLYNVRFVDTPNSIDVLSVCLTQLQLYDFYNVTVLISNDSLKKLSNELDSGGLKLVKRSSGTVSFLGMNVVSTIHIEEDQFIMFDSSCLSIGGSLETIETIVTNSKGVIVDSFERVKNLIKTK